MSRRERLEKYLFERRVLLWRRWAVSSRAISRDASKLIALGRFAEADAILEKGLGAFPRGLRLLELYALSAHNSGRYAEAIERWRRLKDLRPDLPMAWCGVASNTRELGLLDQAELAVVDALKRFPNDYLIISEAARIYDCLGAYAKAIVFWRRMVDHPPFPVAVDWLQGLATVAIRLDLYEEGEAALVRIVGQSGQDRSEDLRHEVAEAWCDLAGRINTVIDQQRLYEKGMERFPESIRMLGSAARMAEVVLDPTKAAKLYHHLMQLEPGDLDWRAGYVSALIDLDRADEAEKAINEGLLIDPDHENLTLSRGLVAMRRQNWEEALPILSAYASAHPDNDLARDRTERIRRLQLLDKAAAHEIRATANGPLAVGFTDDPSARQLLLNFESMGIDCEFGGVQRHYGAEPLGLLRWNDTSYPTLSAALSADFAGMGDPEQTELVVGNAQEIDLRDKRWDLRMHTFMRDDEISKEALLPKMQKRVSYLREKMLADLRVGEKIFLYKDKRIQVSQLYHLHDLLQKFGPNALLYVKRAGEPEQRGFAAAGVGEVIELRPNLYVGYIERIDDLHNIIFPGWLDVCRTTADLILRQSTVATSEKLSHTPPGPNSTHGSLVENWSRHRRNPPSIR